MITADLNSKLVEAAASGNVVALRAALNAGAEVNAMNIDGYSALALAAVYGHRDCLQSLIAAGAEVNVQDREGNSTLMHTSTKGNISTMECLIAAGADIDARNRNGDTALMRAVRNGKVGMMRCLIANGAVLPDLKWACKVIDSYTEAVIGECFAVLVKESGVAPTLALQLIKKIKNEAAQTARSMLQAQSLDSYSKDYVPRIQKVRHV